MRNGALRVADWTVPFAASAPAGPVTLGIRPGALRLAGEGLSARVYLVEPMGETTIVNLLVGDTLVKLRTDRPGALREGDTAHISFDFVDIHLFNVSTGRRL